MTLYVLMLNDMRASNIENLHAVKWGPDRDELVRFHNDARVEPYVDNTWRKQFPKGHELEWCNPSDDLKTDGAYWGGIYRFPDAPDDASAAGLYIGKG